jgi:hypothetical protein
LQKVYLTCPPPYPTARHARRQPRHATQRRFFVTDRPHGRKPAGKRSICPRAAPNMLIKRQISRAKKSENQARPYRLCLLMLILRAHGAVRPLLLDGVAQSRRSECGLASGWYARAASAPKRRFRSRTTPGIRPDPRVGRCLNVRLIEGSRSCSACVWPLLLNGMARSRRSARGLASRGYVRAVSVPKHRFRSHTAPGTRPDPRVGRCLDVRLIEGQRSCSAVTTRQYGAVSAARARFGVPGVCTGGPGAIQWGW